MTTTLSSFTQSPQQYWQWRGHNICYSVSGSGYPLVLVHGFGASIGHWRKNIPDWARHYQVYAVDLLGFGASAKPNLAYSMELWAEMLADFWQAQVGQPAVWIGNSIGGLLCVSMAANYGHTCAGLVVLNCAGGLSHRPQELGWPQRLLMKSFTTLMASPILGTFIFNQIRQPARIRKTLTQVYANPEAITDELVEILYRPACDRGAQQVFARVVTAPPGPRIADLMPRVKTPILVLWGEADPWTPVAGGKVFDDYRQSMPIEFVVLADTGHCPHDDRPEQVNPIVIDWLGRILEH